MNKQYDFKAIEQKWRPYWSSLDLYRTGDDPTKPKYYILDFFPYPSGDGLSVGHCRNYVPTCVSARFMRMKGYNVLHPMGWDAFGLPAENDAIKRAVHPQITTQRHTSNYRRQMQLVECSYDWSREINSTDPDYYRWTQWFFLLLFQRGLAYRAIGSQWWCPVDQTILANEQVENGRCWRCGSEVTRKDLEQWYFKITDYADRLIADLDTIDWPDNIIQMQRNWIGRSQGAEITFPVEGTDPITVFTTRPDTLFGVTFLVLAPEHPLVATITADPQRAEVTAYVERAKRMTEIDRLATDKEKTGVFTGAYATHPVTGRAVPIWIADYVLFGYGTGAIMAVPAHDSRDHAFAQRYHLPITTVVEPVERIVNSFFDGYGRMINSSDYTGLSSEEGGRRLVADLEAQGLARPQTTYKMRDWLISRQRYWGAPIPIIHCDTCGPVAVPDDQLPVLLPDIADFAPDGDGRSPLAKVESWVNTTCPHCGRPARRETDTMDGFACSSWYFLRFANPHYQEAPFDPAAVRYWLPTDTYVGGAEHAVMHLLYARFWTKVMYDAGLIHFTEPFTQLRNQGVLHAADGQRMSKSKGNVVTPDEVIAQHGTDALRAYILFIGPFDGDVIWDDTGIRGVIRFLERYHRLAQSPISNPQSPTSSDALIRHHTHRLIQRVTTDFDQFKFNTAVASLMEYLNQLADTDKDTISPAVWRQAIETFTILLAPIAPFITEEIWQEQLGYQGQSVHQQPWPTYDPALTTAAEITLIIQINGKLRDRITVPTDTPEPQLQTIALSREAIQKHLNGRPIHQIIHVPQKLLNIVTT
jgi:leucyl-tRNA synthetase